MNLRSKVISTSAFMLAVSTVGLGSLAVGITYQQGIANIRVELRELVAIVESDPDPLSAAVYEFDGLSVNVQFKQEDGSSTFLQEAFSTDGVYGEISEAIDLGYGESLVISKSTKSIQNLVADLIPLVLISSIVLSALSGLVLYAALRNDVEGIRLLAQFAKNKAAGETTELSEAKVSSEIQDLSETLNLMVSSLEQAQENLREFLSDSSHELKTPLTVIRGYVEILQQESRDEITSERLKKIHREAIKMQNLVADLLLLAEIESSTPIRPSDFNLGQLVDEVIENQEVLAPQMSFVSTVGTDVIVHADRVLIDRYLTNALSNVRLHTPSNTRAWVTANVQDSKVDLIIEDNGPGLPSELMVSEDIRFRRKKAEGGTGLGLSIMKGVVRKHESELVLGNSSHGGLKLSASIQRGKQ